MRQQLPKLSQPTARYRVLGSQCEVKQYLGVRNQPLIAPTRLTQTFQEAIYLPTKVSGNQQLLLDSCYTAGDFLQSTPYCSVAPGKAGVLFTLPITQNTVAYPGNAMSTWSTSGMSIDFKIPNPWIGTRVFARIYMIGSASDVGIFWATDSKGGSSGSGELAQWAGYLPPINDPYYTVSFRNMYLNWGSTAGADFPMMSLLMGNSIQLNTTSFHLDNNYGHMCTGQIAQYSMAPNLVLEANGGGGSAATINYSDATSYPSSGFRFANGIAGSNTYSTPFGNITTLNAAAGSSITYNGVTYGARQNCTSSNSQQLGGPTGALIMIVYG